MRNNKSFFLIATILVLVLSCNNLTLYNNSFNAFSLAMLDEVNYARTNPSGYAESRLKSYYEDGTDNGAYEDISTWEAVGQLTLNSQLCIAADKFAEYMAVNNVFGHYADGSTPSERCEAEGYSSYSGENIAANSAQNMDGDTNPQEAAKEFVIQLIIDKGVPDLGHRKNIMGETHKVLGVGFHRNINATYKNYCVQDFGSK